MKFIVFPAFYGMYIFDGLQKSSIWSHSRRKVENCLICRLYKWDCFLFCVYIFEMLNRGVCGMRPVDHRDWRWNLVRDQITSSLSSSLSLSSMCRASWFDSFRFLFLKNKRSNKHWISNATSLVQSVPIFFPFIPHRKQSQCGKWFERQVFVWLKSIDTQVFNMYIVTTFGISLLLIRSAVCCLLCFVRCACILLLLSVAQQKGDHSKSLDGRRQSLCRTMLFLAIACMHACYQLEILNSCMAIIWL